MAHIVEFEALAAIERQACEWLIRLDGDRPLNDTEIQALREWMSRSPLHREKFTHIYRFWTQANVLIQLAVPLEPAIQARRRPARRLILAVASAIFASLLLTWGSLQQRHGVTNGTYGTAIGQQQTITLPDGSAVQLNTDSQVQVSYSGTRRGIRLLRGEALFSVVTDKSRPFDVYVADSVIRAVGTAFAVRLEDGIVDLTVTKGVVAVAEARSALTVASGGLLESGPPRTNVAQVNAGQTTSFASGANHINVHRLTALELQRRLAWQEGYLVFFGEPLSEVIRQLNRYSPISLRVDDPRLAAIAIGGRFRVGDLDSILAALHTRFAIDSHQLNQRTIRLESHPPR